MYQAIGCQISLNQCRKIILITRRPLDFVYPVYPHETPLIYTTVQSVPYQAKQHDATYIPTFDQLLSRKALTTIQSQTVSRELKRNVIRLRGFHMWMSFLGSIVLLMASLGMQELIEIIFAINAISRAVRRQMLIDAALNTIFVAKAYYIPMTTKETDALKRDTARLLRQAMRRYDIQANGMALLM